LAAFVAVVAVADNYYYVDYDVRDADDDDVVVVVVVVVADAV
jgi:hypothetical protein